MKYKSLAILQQEVHEALKKGQINRALKIIYDFVQSVIIEPLCTGHGLGSRMLDSLCQHIGQENFKLLDLEKDSLPRQSSKTMTYIYLASKLQKSGGHTRVIQDFISARPHAHHLILLTELCGASDEVFLKTMWGQSNTIKWQKAPRGNFKKKLDWLQTQLFLKAAEKVYLFNHPQDCIAVAAVAAVQTEMKLNVSFYHHADHHLCLGVFLPQVEHIDIHSAGYHHCREIFGLKNIYLPLVVEDRGQIKKSFIANGHLITCTAARSNKLEVPYVVSYFDLIPRLLEVTKGRHIHIGYLSPWMLFKLKSSLKQRGIRAAQFVYIPWVPSVWEALQEYSVDLYIASFPYGGGLTLIEAMGAGIPVALHSHLYSRVLSSVDLGHPEIFNWKDAEELLDYCKQINADELMRQQALGRSHYEKYHRQEILADLLKNNQSLAVTDLNKNYQIRHDEWACWISNAINMTSLFKRQAYRLFLSLRRIFVF